MSRSRARTSQVGVSLFPFLDVLLSTMGALILLFAIITRTPLGHVIRSAHDPGTSPPAQDLEAERELLELRINQLAEQRSKTQEDLRRQQLELGHLEEDAQKLRAELDQLVQSARQIGNQHAFTNQERAQLEFEIGRKEAEIARKRLEVDELRRLAAQSASYAIIPYVGPNGTYRIPIYLECRSDAIVLQPEGISFTEQDFEGPLGPGNPLAAAIRAAREFIWRNREAGTGETGEPYPLLLVRPDGIEGYWVAREALQSWGTDFGYELVDADWELAFKQPDPELADQIERAVAVAREQQLLLAQLAPRSLGSSRAFRANPHGSGIIAEDGPSYGSEDGYGYGHGHGRRRGHGRFAGGQPGGHDDAEARWGAGDASRRGSGRGAAGRGSGADPSGVAERAAPGDIGGTAMGTGQNRLADAGGDGGLYPPEASLEGSQGGTGTKFASSGTPGRGSGQGRGASPNWGGGASDGDSTKGGETAGAGRREDRPTTGRDGPRGGSASSGSSASEGGPSALDTAGTASRSSQSGGSSGGGASIQYAPQSHVRSLAEKRGKDWGKPEAARGATPVTRPILLECRPHSIAVMADDGSRRQIQTIALNAQTEDSIDELMAAVWKHIETWGIAGNGLYWHPILVLDVVTGGETRAADLEGLLADSGIAVKRRGTSMITQAPSRGEKR